MIERLIEYKEAREFRKERKRKQDQKRALMVLVPCMAILLIGAGISAIMGKEEPAPVVKAVATPSQVSKPVEVVPSVNEEEIEKFAYIMTKPIEDVTGDELEFMGEKAEDPCYEQYSLLPAERMVAKITACKEAG
jgi:hypothetical protein